eukprot:TRINITY_DN4472_c0_g1_i1.p1 TRINITY_DN4472_c0_g1~~TRINITY_DN4472_c0_g1_i1.p1  ORF type:complete len:770 (-),score=148.43 TRINITY_DN4472_c0_g1_i1:38-2248(-)
MSKKTVTNADLNITKIIGNILTDKGLPLHMFELDIENYMDSQKKILPYLNVPYIIRKCCYCIIAYGCAVEGIFRIPGSNQEVERVVGMINGGEVPEFDGKGVNDVASVLKKYLRELERPLLSDGEDESVERFFLEAIDLTDHEALLLKIKSGLVMLNGYRYSLLKELMYTLSCISIHSEVNKMDATNLATIFGGMVNILSSVMSSSQKTELCELLIENYDYFFEAPPSIHPKLEPGHGVRNIVQVYFSDGTYKAKICRGEETASELKSYMIDKILLSNPDFNAESSYLFEVKDREYRRIEDDEYVVPIFQNESLIILDDILDSLQDKLVQKIRGSLPSTEKDSTKVISVPTKIRSKRRRISKRKEKRSSNYFDEWETWSNDMKKDKFLRYEEKCREMNNQLLSVYLKNILLFFPDHELTAVQATVSKILLLHESLYDLVSKEGFDVCDAIKEKEAEFAHYISYFKILPSITDQLKGLKKDIELQKVIEECKLQATTSATFSQLLFFPAAHLTKYRKFFEIILEDKESKIFSSCLHKINSFSRHVFDFDPFGTENMLNKIEELFLDLQISLNVGKRKYIRNGSFDIKISFEGHERNIHGQIFLLNDALLIGKKNKKRYNYEQFIPIDKLEVHKGKNCLFLDCNEFRDGLSLKCTAKGGENIHTWEREIEKLKYLSTNNRRSKMARSRSVTEILVKPSTSEPTNLIQKVKSTKLKKQSHTGTIGRRKPHRASVSIFNP